MRSLTWLTVVVMLGVCNPACSNGDKCEGNLAEIGSGCPSSFDGTMEGLPPCSAGSSGVLPDMVWLCGDLIVLTRGWGFGSRTCYFDRLSNALVGAAEGSDVPSYCGQSSHTIQAGRTTNACFEQEPALTRRCETPPATDAGAL